MAYYRDHPEQQEKARARARQWRIDHPDRAREAKARQYRQRRDEILAYGKRRRDQTKAERKAAWACWKRANPEKALALQRRYQFRRREDRNRRQRERYAANPEKYIKASCASTKRKRAAGWKPNHAGRSMQSRRQSSIQQLRWRLKKQFGGKMPPAWLVEARELALMVQWEERAARKAHDV